jgi:DNA-binding transcriptional ArsR family regulator
MRVKPQVGFTHKIQLKFIILYYKRTIAYLVIVIIYKTDRKIKMAKDRLNKTNEKTFSKYFKAFGDPTRLRIIALLSAKEMTVNEIVKAVGLSQPNVSRHLALLREADVVIDRRQAQQVFYSLNKGSIETCCQDFCCCLENSPKNCKKP